MDLLKRSELPAWLLKRFGSASVLAATLNTTRQTAHNIITGRTIPNYETCEKLGLELVFLLAEKRRSEEMVNLDDFLSRRAEQAGIAEVEQNKIRLLREKGFAMWNDLQQVTRERAEHVGSIDGVPFEWNPYPFLKLQPVAATFTTGTIVNDVPQHCRVIFGRIPNAMYVDDNSLGTQVWDIKLSVAGNEMVWDVNEDEVIGALPTQLAEQIIKRLIEYRDEYQAHFASGAWLT
jgi:hypothetical protein